MPYHTSQWNGLPNFECDDCAFATLDEDKAKAHDAATHASTQITPPTPHEPNHLPHAPSA